MSDHQSNMVSSGDQNISIERFDSPEYTMEVVEKGVIGPMNLENVKDELRSSLFMVSLSVPRNPNDRINVQTTMQNLHGYIASNRKDMTDFPFLILDIRSVKSPQEYQALMGLLKDINFGGLLLSTALIVDFTTSAAMLPAEQLVIHLQKVCGLKHVGYTSTVIDSIEAFKASEDSIQE